MTAPYILEQNGVMECINRTIVEKVKAMFFDLQSPYNLWLEIVQTATYLRNWTLSRGEDKTPEE